MNAKEVIELAKEQYDRAHKFILDYVRNVWYCNMAEGNNEGFNQINEQGIVVK